MPGPDKLSILLQDGDYDRVHTALVAAAAAAASGLPVTVFATLSGIALLRRSNGGCAPGWHGLARATERDRELTARGVAGMEVLIESCAALGTRFIVCEAGLRGMGWSVDDLRADFPIEIAGAVTFIADASANGMVLFV